MPDASSSAPGERVFSVVRPTVESRWPPSTTVPAAGSLPRIVRITDFCGKPVCANCSTVMSAREPASCFHCSASQSDAATPCDVV